MGQLGFFDADNRLTALSAKGDPEKRPVFIAQIKSHDPPPRTVNHVRSNYSNIYLGTDLSCWNTRPYAGHSGGKTV
jgi:hypothetical protein